MAEMPLEHLVSGDGVGRNTGRMGKRAENRGNSPGGAPPSDTHSWDGFLERCRPVLSLKARLEWNYRLWKRVPPSELVQNALLAAHKDRGQFRGTSEAQYMAWLNKILINTIKDEARKLICEKRNPDLEVPITEALVRNTNSPSRIAMGNEEVFMLAAALERLTEPQRRAVELCYLQQLERSEVAKIMEGTPQSIANLLHRGLARLLDLLKGMR